MNDEKIKITISPRARESKQTNSHHRDISKNPIIFGDGYSQIFSGNRLSAIQNGKSRTSILTMLDTLTH